MAGDERPTGPYAPLKNVMEVVNRLRERGVPSPLTAESLTVIGVPTGNAPRTLQAVKFLGIVDSKGQITEAAERLRRSTTEEYPALLGEMIRAAYVRVFELVDPDTDGDVKVADAFRQFDPAGQREKMVTLFMGLCEVAGIVQPDTSKSQRTSSTRVRTATRATASVARGTARQPIVVASQAPQANPNLLFGVTVEDIGALPVDEFDSVWSALGKIARARAQSLKAVQDMAEQARARREEEAVGEDE